MAKKKGTLKQIADAVGDVVQAVAVGVGLTSAAEDGQSDQAPQSKSERKAARKTAIARVEKKQQDATVARKAARRRGSKPSARDAFPIQLNGPAASTS